MTIGNRVTNNALIADDGKSLIKKALKEIEEKYGWVASAKEPLFSGVYYDSAKVGSFVVKAKNDRGDKAIIKLQLYPLEFDEGFIIRHVESNNGSKHVRLPKILKDDAWNKKRGYGFLILEDLSDLPDLWKSGCAVGRKEMENHKKFLKEFLHNVLPVNPWLKNPTRSATELQKESFFHFYNIATKSQHHHINQEEIDLYKDRYFKILDKMKFEKAHFTHGHLSGFDIKYDEKNRDYILLANLYWSYRPQYYEIIFPIWVNLMRVKDKNLKFNDFLKIINKWGEMWKDGLYDTDPGEQKEYWFHLLTRSVLTIMLDLGSSEWKKKEKPAKQALLNCWKEFFEWLIIDKRLTYH